MVTCWDRVGGTKGDYRGILWGLVREVSGGMGLYTNLFKALNAYITAW